MSSAPDAPDEDVKALLGRALADEPPLALDRDAVFLQGRRTLRNRRLFSTGGVIVGVVAAAVGAVMLTGLLVDEPEREVPPAATRTGHPAPPGPTLPLTTTPRLPAGPSTEAPPPIMSPGQADRLTSALAKAQVLDSIQLTGVGGGLAKFQTSSHTYDLQADVLSPAAEGSLYVSVGWADPGTRVGCGQIVDANAGCEVTDGGGIAVAVGTWKDDGTGEVRYTVFAVHPDGTSVTAISTNLSERVRDGGALPKDKIPLVDSKMLVEIAADANLRFAD